MNKLEKTTINISTTILAYVLSSIFYLIRLIAKTLYRLKRHLFRLAIIILLTNSALMSINQIAYAPKAMAALTEFRAVANPLTEKEQIVNYILERFGPDGQNAIKIANCESRLNPIVQGHNTNGSVDTGVFQINSVHAINANYLKDWHVNIDVAYKMFKEQGWGPWSCQSVYGVLGR